MSYKKIYVCSPLRGDIKQNILNATRYCKEIANMGEIPICPHIYFTQFLDDNKKEDREKGMAMGIELLKDCDYMFVCCGNGISEGMMEEIKIAESLQIPVVYQAWHTEEEE